MMKGNPVSPKALFWLIALITLVGGGFTIRALSAGQLSSNESLLLSVLLTIFSTGAGWLISHTLYQDSRGSQIQQIREEYERNIEVYAVKASEKVINLSNQIGRVVDYLNDDEEDNSADQLQQLKHRHKAVIHMLGTLKSINDTSLSDWEGVIGERLEDKRKIDQRRDHEINSLIAELKHKSNDTTEEKDPASFNEILRELRRLSSKEASLPPSRKGGFRELRCPDCGSFVRVKANKNGKINKSAVSCPSCKKSLAVSGRDTSEPTLIPRSISAEGVNCPSCNKLNAILLDNVAGSLSNGNCQNCGEPFSAHRNMLGGVSIRLVGIPVNKVASPLDESFVRQVEMLLPAQPWPTGIHRDIAEKLDCTPSKVGKATQQLIREGKYKPQIDGQLVTEDYQYEGELPKSR